MSDGRRWGTWLAMIGPVVALWVGAAVPSRFSGGLLVAAVVASTVTVVSGIVLIIRSRMDEKDSPHRERPTAIHAENVDGLDIRDNYFGPGIDPLRVKDSKGVGFSGNVSEGEPPQDLPTKRRRSWSFPEMPWKKKTPSD